MHSQRFPPVLKVVMASGMYMPLTVGQSRRLILPSLSDASNFTPLPHSYIRTPESKHTLSSVCLRQNLDEIFHQTGDEESTVLGKKKSMHGVWLLREGGWMDQVAVRLCTVCRRLPPPLPNTQKKRCTTSVSLT